MATTQPAWAKEMIGAYSQFPERANDQMTYKLVEVQAATPYRGVTFVMQPVLHTERDNLRYVSLDAYSEMISVGVN